ncbi:unnamed protein product [Nippostrongylus brasiliensis]|uniref:Galectin n=1 Tax=Nippostrongylus brasiliensis TaxID=27835 RepID=A0A0N4XKD3_NIPBR|nr:unnamed protein product [Nippostrongylus brasiliensis]
MAGQTLNIHGAINADANRVEINLLHGAAQIDPGQAVFHMNLRFDEGKIVMNSYVFAVDIFSYVRCFALIRVYSKADDK